MLLENTFLCGGSPHCVVANVLDCNIIVIEFEFQLHYYVHFWTNTFEKGMNSLIPSNYRLKSTTSVFLQ